MKKSISLMLALCVFCNVAFADNCDWTQIKKLPDGGYEYNPTLNLCVGNLVQDDAIKTQQVADLTTAVQLKNAALLAADQRTILWTNTAESEQDRMNKLSSEQSHSDFIYFGLGILSTIGVGYVVSQAYRH